MDLSSVPVEIPTDVLRHICIKISPDTNIAARFGLTSKLWYREVWKWQTGLIVSHSDALLSLSKRKNIIDSKLESLVISVAYEPPYHMNNQEKFLKRFLEGSGATLTSLIVNQSSSATVTNTDDLWRTIGPNLKYLNLIQRRHQYYYVNPPNLTASFLKAATAVQFRMSLSSLALEFASSAYISGALRTISDCFPNLRELKLLSSSTDHPYGMDFAAAARDYSRLIQPLKQLQSFVVPADSPLQQCLVLYRGPNVYNRQNFVGYEKIQQFTKFVHSNFVDDRLIRLLSIEKIGSLSTMALSLFLGFKTIECLLNLGWPLQIYGSCSVAGLVLVRYINGDIDGSQIIRILQPMFERSGLVDLHATSQIGNDGVCANVLQLAVLTGEDRILSMILAQTAALADRDLHILMSAGNVNLFHAAAVYVRPENVLSVFKLIFSRQNQLGLFTSLCYEERGASHETVLEALLRSHNAEAVKFLIEKGVSLYPITRRHPKAPPSLLYSIFSQRPPAHFFQALEKILLSHDQFYRGSLPLELERRFPNAPNSLLARLVQSTATSLLNKFLVVATQEQKNQALKEVSEFSQFHALHEKLLLNSGADPTAAVSDDGKTILMLVAQRSDSGRGLLMIQTKGSIIAAKSDEKGRFAAHYAADALSTQITRDDEKLSAPYDLLRALMQSPEIKNSKETLQHVFDNLKAHVTHTAILPTEAIAAATKLRDDVQKWIKSAK